MRLLKDNRIVGWRRHLPVLGRPDFAFPKEKLAIYVDGCFWHGCPRHSNMPANNREFWERKLTGNKNRDRFVTKSMRQKGWTVLRIWEHDLSKKSAPKTVKKIAAVLVKWGKNRAGVQKI